MQGRSSDLYEITLVCMQPVHLLKLPSVPFIYRTTIYNAAGQLYTVAVVYGK